VLAAQEAQELDLFRAGNNLVRPAEGHAGLGELLQQLLDRGTNQICERTNGCFRH
jgi:hypothetical protein